MNMDPSPPTVRQRTAPRPSSFSGQFPNMAIPVSKAASRKLVAKKQSPSLAAYVS